MLQCHLLLKVPAKGPPIMVHQWTFYGEIPAFRTCFYIYLRIPSKGSLPLSSPCNGAIESVAQLPSSLHLSLEVWGSQGGTPHQGSPHRAPIDRLSICLSKFLVNRLPTGAPIERDTLL